MVYVPPITQAEFLQALQKCIPPRGWPKRIAVANSGGPDSTCLLFLLSNLVREKKLRRGFPQSIVSIHVNHKLQDAADDMEDKASKFAAEHGVPHVTATIPWGVHPFPTKPLRAMEVTARRARYNRLFDSMTTLQAPCLALGQHADDQVETMILRLANGSTILGASGMQYVRRWGMGGQSELDFCGYEGMSRYIIRPFLEIPKDRILATCEAHKLEYVVDQTNFQPQVALRNEIRGMLAPRAGSASPETEQLSPERLKFQSVIERLGGGPLKTQERAALYGPNKVMQDEVQALSSKVTSILKRILLRSPPSTVLITQESLREITDPQLRTSVCRRLVRYISSYPWGHMAAEIKGRQAAYEALVEKVWSGAEGESYRSYSFGSNVLWHPVAITERGFIRYRRPEEGEQAAWFLSREPPRSWQSKDQQERMNPLIVDITPKVASQIDRRGTVKVLYDCRFLITFHMDRFPKWLQAEFENPKKDPRIIIRNHSKFYLPQVILKREGEEDVVLMFARWDDRQPGFRNFVWSNTEWNRWIDASFARTYSHL